jgi:hypothetical protein
MIHFFCGGAVKYAARRGGKTDSEIFERYPLFVIPAEAGIQKALKRQDSCFRRNDDLSSSRLNSKVSQFHYFDRLNSESVLARLLLLDESNGNREALKVP